ncbi:RNA methyltransferase [Porphyromonas gulae]|uniref:23S rRNA (guanosine(2251)-2'-O)-methyltransferase RlmB n=1 Tax=Porphyromonas gulae TaxID=111105 RepID=UPI00052D2758|nr:23S rRNA (guanosine(2251)-2'-O)-methyltransferase RlmB [Porphyromonas gulae]KGN71065.1 RNA methyltransferase [Porphyromonas gulae]
MKNDKMIFGLHSISEAFEAGKEIDKIFIRRGLKTEQTDAIIREAAERCVPVMHVPTEKLDRLTTKNHQGVVAILSAIEYTRLDQLIPMLYEEGKAPFLLLLDGITDVRNFGAIARTAECAGVDAIIIPERGSVSVGGDAIKTSAGALHRIPVCRVTSIPGAIRSLQEYGIRIVAASEKAADLYTDVPMELPLGIVLGAEDVGPSPDTLRMADGIVAIPQMGSIGSLNVSVAAGIVIYEVVRQQRLQSSNS